MRILIIEDHLDQASAMQFWLEELRHSPLIVLDNSMALNELAQNIFDLVLCDPGPPYGDGFEFVREIKAIYNVQCVALSSYAYPGDRQRALFEGFFEYLRKPIDHGKLEAVLNDVRKLILRRQFPERGHFN